jgi:CheY-like chemotaxis protein
MQGPRPGILSRYRAKVPKFLADTTSEEVLKGILVQTVLLIEDSKFLRIANQHILVKAGYNVVSGGDGHEALHLAGQCHPDVILLDMMLPKLSGLEVLRTLKQDPATAHIPVIILTGLSQKNEASLRRDGASGFVEKDTVLQNSRLLLDAIEGVLRKQVSADRCNPVVGELRPRL